MRKILLGAALLAAATVPTLLAASGPIVAPAGAEWTHAGTNVVLPPTLAGLPRGAMTDNSDSQIDVAAQYDDHHGTFATMYLFRPSLMSVPVWFDRSETMILARDIYANAKPVGETAAFAPPRGGTASGLRRAYLPGGGSFKSTTLGIMPLGAWLVAVRMSSQTLDPAALDARMTKLIGAIGWPTGVAEAGVGAAPVAACTDALIFAKVPKLRKPEPSGAIADAFESLAPPGWAPSGTPPPLWCRERPGTVAFGVYRAAGQAGYALALGDAGAAITVTPALTVKGKTNGYRLSLRMLDRTMNYLSFDTLPAPEVAIAIVSNSQPISTTATKPPVAAAGTTITLR